MEPIQEEGRGGGDTEVDDSSESGLEDHCRDEEVNGQGGDYPSSDEEIGGQDMEEDVEEEDLYATRTPPLQL